MSILLLETTWPVSNDGMRPITRTLGIRAYFLGETELNIAENAEAHAAGKHSGYEPTAWEGIEQTVDLLAEKRIKVIINGGVLNPKGLAEKTQELVSSLSNEAAISEIMAFASGYTKGSLAQDRVRGR